MSTEESVRLDTAGTEAHDYPDERPYPGFVRVNLLPDSILARLRVVRAKRIALVAIIIALVLVLGLWLLAQREIATAQSRVDEAEANNRQLQAQVAELSQVPAVFATAERAQESLNAAMGNEIRWAFLLNQLSFATPPDVTLDSVAGELVADSAEPTSPGGVLPAQETVGTMTFSGSASNFAAVASWLDSLHALRDYTYPFLTNSTRNEDDRRVAWESTANLSTNALSGTYGKPVPAPGTTTPEPTPAPQPAPNGQQPPSDGAQ